MSSVSRGSKRTGLIRSCLQRGIPIHFGGASDPLQPSELEYRVTYRLLEVLRQYEYPFVLSTKSDLIAQPEYLSLIRDAPAVVQISFSTLNDELAKRLEPNAPAPSARLETLSCLAQHGVWTVARLQPFLYPREKIETVIFQRLAETGVRHIVLEHLRIPTNSRISARRALWRALGMDLLAAYRHLGIAYSRVNYELNPESKLANILQARALAHKFGIGFGSGDNDFHHISDHLCCCGIPDREDFRVVYDGHLGVGLYNAVRTGKVSFKYLDEAWQPKGSVQEYINSHCRVRGCTSALDFLRDRLAKPGSSNSPISFHGIQWVGNDRYVIDKQFLDRLTLEGDRYEKDQG